MQERVFAMAHYADQGVLYLLIILAMMTVYMVVERYLYLRKKVASSQSLKQVLEISLITQQLDQGLFRVAKEFPQSSEGRLADLYLRYQQAGKASGFNEVYKTFVAIEKPRLERHLSFLATVGSNAPYIGLFGTVLGIMKAFQDMASQTGASGQNAVMAGISGALIATAAGLMVAIPAVLAYNYFQKQVKTIIGSLESVEDLARSATNVQGS